MFVDRETGLAQVFPEYCSEGHALSIPCKYTTSMALGHWASTISASQALCGRHYESPKSYIESRKRNLKFLSSVSRGEREIKSSYSSRVEIEISKKRYTCAANDLFASKTP